MKKVLFLLVCISCSLLIGCDSEGEGDYYIDLTVNGNDYSFSQGTTYNSVSISEACLAIDNDVPEFYIYGTDDGTNDVEIQVNTDFYDGALTGGSIGDAQVSIASLGVFGVSSYIITNYKLNYDENDGISGYAEGTFIYGASQQGEFRVKIVDVTAP